MIAVRELMSTELLILKDTDSVSKVRHLMAEKHVRHIPIVNEANEFVGLVSQRDVLASTVSILADMDGEEIEALESAIPIREVMSTNMVAVDENTDLTEAAQFLLEHKIGCLPVLSHSKLVGIITESDFLKLVIKLLSKQES